MATKRECAVLGCVVSPKGGSEACAAHRATYVLQKEIMARQELEQEVEQLIDLLLNFEDRQEQLDLLRIGFPDQFKRWEALNAKLEIPEQQEPPDSCYSAIGRELQTGSPLMKSSETPADFPPTQALPSPAPEHQVRAVQAVRRVLRRLLPTPKPGGRGFDIQRSRPEPGSALELPGPKRSA